MEKKEEGHPVSRNDGSFGKVLGDHEEKYFLEGHHSRFFELKRAFRIFFECIRGFRAFHFLGPCVTIFGSARFSEKHPYYQMAMEIGGKIAEEGFTVMTGGGPGIMEAANRGAKMSGGASIGCNITLPKEQKPNPYLDCWVEFRYFFVRKLMLAKYSYAFIILPGGFGTLDELFEVAVLIQTKKIKNFPVILMGTEYWQGLIEFMKERLQAEGAIDGSDLEVFRLTDSPSEAARIVREAAIDQFGLKKFKPRKPSKLLREGKVTHQSKS